MAQYDLLAEAYLPDLATLENFVTVNRINMHWLAGMAKMGISKLRSLRIPAILEILGLQSSRSDGYKAVIKAMERCQANFSSSEDYNWDITGTRGRKIQYHM